MPSSRDLWLFAQSLKEVEMPFYQAAFQFQSQHIHLHSVLWRWRIWLWKSRDSLVLEQDPRWQSWGECLRDVCIPEVFFGSLLTHHFIFGEIILILSKDRLSIGLFGQRKFQLMFCFTPWLQLHITPHKQTPVQRAPCALHSLPSHLGGEDEEIHRRICRCWDDISISKASPCPFHSLWTLWVVTSTFSRTKKQRWTVLRVVSVLEMEATVPPRFSRQCSSALAGQPLSANNFPHA